MKKLLTIALALVTVLSMAVPASAATTSVTVAAGGGTAPVVKVKWEQEPDNNIVPPPSQPVLNSLESGDKAHATPGSQFNPPMIKSAVKMIDYYAIVTDEEEGGNVAQVFVDVYHPNGVPAPYSTSPDPRGGLFKYEIPFVKLGHSQAEIDLLVTANNANLTKFAPAFDVAEVIFELTKGTADLWKGSKAIDYEQPAGDYEVRAYAIDHNSNVSLPLVNTFLYVPIAGVEVDFTGINYGSVSLGVEKMVAGDTVWNPIPGLAPNPNLATVRNIGNTWAHVVLNQTDLGLGKDGNGMWNVMFDARMGSDNANYVQYEPLQTKTLPNYLALSSQDELDLSIKVIKGFTGVTYTGTMTIGAAAEPFTSPAPVINPP